MRLPHKCDNQIVWLQDRLRDGQTDNMSHTSEPSRWSVPSPGVPAVASSSPRGPAWIPGRLRSAGSPALVLPWSCGEARSSGPYPEGSQCHGIPPVCNGKIHKLMLCNTNIFYFEISTKERYWFKLKLFIPNHFKYCKAIFFLFWVTENDIQWWFINADMFVPNRYFRINKISGLLNRPSVQKRKSVFALLSG